MACIYLLKDALGNVVYVGQTVNPKRRLKEHRLLMGSGVNMEIIVDNPPDIGEAEKHWIAFYRANGVQLRNISGGARGRGLVAPETLAKLSAAKKGKRKPEGFGAKLSSITRGLPHAWTVDGMQRAAVTQFKQGTNSLATASDEGKLRHRQNSISVAKRLTFEERSARVTKAWANSTQEQRQERSRAIAEGRASAGLKSHWETADPANIAAARAKISEKLKAAWARRKEEAKS